MISLTMQVRPVESGLCKANASLILLDGLDGILKMATATAGHQRPLTETVEPRHSQVIAQDQIGVVVRGTQRLNEYATRIIGRKGENVFKIEDMIVQSGAVHFPQ
jgi:hypothetical protein